MKKRDYGILFYPEIRLLKMRYLCINMRRIPAILFLFIITLPACNKGNENSSSGTATINNTLYMDQSLQTYYSYGFLFSSGKLVSILNTPPPDITINNDGTLGDLRLEADNFDNSFYKVGQYPDATTAKEVFDTLVSPTVLQWVVWADSLNSNQVWLYKSGNEHYSKIRIVSTISEVRDSLDYAECTFQWVYQPNGSLTFPR
ncbi:MAG: hypothetical protein ABSG89_06885 [Bacteroidales bacterium]|jgi:hypothetical protein